MQENTDQKNPYLDTFHAFLSFGKREFFRNVQEDSNIPKKKINTNDQQGFNDINNVLLVD